MTTKNKNARNPGRIVELPDGRKGIVYNSEPFINGKLAVHLQGGKKILVNAKGVLIIGYVD